MRLRLQVDIVCVLSMLMVLELLVLMLVWMLVRVLVKRVLLLVRRCLRLGDSFCYICLPIPRAIARRKD